MLFLLDAVNIEFQLQQKLSTSYMLQHFTTQIHSNRFSSNIHSLEFVVVIVSSCYFALVLLWRVIPIAICEYQKLYCFFLLEMGCTLYVFYLRLYESRQYRII